MALIKPFRQSTASVLAKAYAVINGMGADVKRFSAPTPPLGTLKDQAAKVEPPSRAPTSGVRS